MYGSRSTGRSGRLRSRDRKEVDPETDFVPDSVGLRCPARLTPFAPLCTKTFITLSNMRCSLDHASVYRLSLQYKSTPTTQYTGQCSYELYFLAHLEYVSATPFGNFFVLANIDSVKGK